MNKWSMSLVSLAFVVCVSVVLFGFTNANKNKNPIDAYVVYQRHFEDFIAMTGGK